MFCVIIFLDSFFARIQLAINMQGAWHTWFKHGENFSLAVVLFGHNLFRGTQREYNSKPHKHSIVERILEFSVDIGIFLSPNKFSAVWISLLKV